MRKILISIIILVSLLFLGCIFGIISDKYDRAVTQTTKQLNNFFATLDDEEVIVDSDDIDVIMDAIDDRLGMYFTDAFQQSLRKEINDSLEKEDDYQQDPKVFSFFIYNEGDGFRFAKGEFDRYAAWSTERKKVVTVNLVIDVHEKIREYYGYPIYTDYVYFVKEDGKWIIDKG